MDCLFFYLIFISFVGVYSLCIFCVFGDDLLIFFVALVGSMRLIELLSDKWHVNRIDSVVVVQSMYKFTFPLHSIFFRIY